MKKMLLATFCLCLASSVIAVTSEDKVTFEKGMASAKKNLHGKTITPEQTIDTWNRYTTAPISSSASDDTEEWTLIKTLNSNCKAGCSLPDVTKYSELMIFASNDRKSRSSIVIPTSNLIFSKTSPRRYVISISQNQRENTLVDFHFESKTRLVAMESYAFSMFNEIYARGKASESGVCRDGESQSKTTGCSSGRTCETGTDRQVCSNGHWLPWETISRPICVSMNQYCP